MYFESTNLGLGFRLGGDNEGKATKRGVLVGLADFALSLATLPKGLPQNSWNMLAPQQSESCYMSDSGDSWYIVFRRKP